MLTGRAGRRGGWGGAGPQPGEGGHGPGDGLARRRGLMRCGGRVCWANAELCAQSVGCSRKAVQGSRGCGACWAGERLRRAVRGLVGRELRCDVRCGLSRASAGCRGGGLRASCAWGCGIERCPGSAPRARRASASRQTTCETKTAPLRRSQELPQRAASGSRAARGNAAHLHGCRRRRTAESEDRQRALDRRLAHPRAPPQPLFVSQKRRLSETRIPHRY